MDPLRDHATVGKRGQSHELECKGLARVTPATLGEAGVIDGELADLQAL